MNKKKKKIKFHVRKRRCKSIIFYGNLCFFSLFKQWSAGSGRLGHMRDTHKMTERSIESLNFIGHCNKSLPQKHLTPNYLNSWFSYTQLYHCMYLNWKYLENREGYNIVQLNFVIFMSPQLKGREDILLLVRVMLASGMHIVCTRYPEPVGGF